MPTDKHVDARDVGITEYRTTRGLTYTALIKSRFSDFIVNEVAENGEVAYLTDLSVPTFPETKISSDASNMAVLSADEQSQMSEQLAEFARADNVLSNLELQVGNDKSKRKAVHELIRSQFGGKLLSETRDDNSCVIRVTRATGNARGGVQTGRERGRGRVREDAWPKTAPNYCRFALYKQNRDTIEAIESIAQRLHIGPRRFSFAGTKDRHAKTTQFVTAYRVRAEELARCINVNSNRQIKRRLHEGGTLVAEKCEEALSLNETSVNDGLRGVKVGNFGYVERPVRLGALLGNRFHIVLRDVRCLENGQDEEELVKTIELRIEELQRDGFLNYFGTQRFGTRSQPTWRIGRCLLQRNWRAAIELILEHSDNFKRKLDTCEGDGEGDKTKESATRTDAETELRKLIDRNTVDSQLRRAVDRYGYTLQAIQSLPRTIRTLYVHAYQSVLWNTVVSRRFREFGSQVLDGDLVQLRNSENEKETTMENEDENAGTQDDELDEWDAQRPAKVAFTIVKKGVNDTLYSIDDVIVPLVGYDVTMPSNVMRDWYVQMMTDHGLVPTADSAEAATEAESHTNTATNSQQHAAPFEFEVLRSTVREFALPGAYRRMCVRPTDVQYHWTRYSSPIEQLCDADWDLLVKAHSTSASLSADSTLGTNTDVDAKADSTTLAEAKRALVLKFTLPSSSYATVALRELLHADV